MAVTRGQQPGAAGRVDSGLRLLAAGPALRRLRWSTDPDAPAAHALCDGQIRLAIQRIDVRPSDLLRSGLVTQQRVGTAADPWRAVIGTGVAEVMESRSSACPVGLIVRGPLPIGTHCVLCVVSADAHGLLAAGVGCATAAPVRYARCAVPPHGAAVAGMDAVEQALMALRDQGHGTATVLPLSVAAVDSSPARSAPITEASCLCK